MGLIVQCGEYPQNYAPKRTVCREGFMWRLTVWLKPVRITQPGHQLHSLLPTVIALTDESSAAWYAPI